MGQHQANNIKILLDYQKTSEGASYMYGSTCTCNCYIVTEVKEILL